MIRFLTPFLLVVGMGATAMAGSYSIGTVDANGYVFLDDGYWHRGANSYTRTAVYHAGCGTGCNYQAPYYSYTYDLYTPTPTVYAPKLPAYTDPGWRTKLLDIAAARDKSEFEIRRGAFEHAQYMEAVTQLGLAGNFRINGYGAPAPYPAYNPVTSAGYQFSGSQVTNYGANAATQYGYNSIASVYGDANLNVLYQQAAQLAQQSQSLGGQANSNFTGLVGQAEGNRGRVAEMLAKGQLAQQVLNALGTGPVTETKQFTFKMDTAGRLQRDDTQVTPEVRTKLSGDFQALASARCAACHDPAGGKVKGDFDITKYTAMSLEQKQAVWLRLQTPDDAKSMPRAEGGAPGKRLTPEEFRLFVLN